MIRVLVVDDDEPMAASIVLMLRAEGIACDTAHLGEVGLEKALIAEYDLIILDVDLPDTDGFDVLRRLRALSIRTPVLMLSGHAGIDNRLRGLNSGADDFLAKPFHRRELIARAYAITRRTRRNPDVVITIGKVSIDLNAQTVRVAGQWLHLTVKEFRVLESLMTRHGRIVSKNSLLGHLNDAANADKPRGKIVAMFVSKLRKKLTNATGGDDCIGTVWGRGYTFGDSASAGRSMSAQHGVTHRIPPEATVEHLDMPPIDAGSR